MKVSLVLTVLNEEKSIDGFLDSLIGQTKKPDEVIIVDGGSSDKTRDRIKNYVLSIKHLVIIRKTGANRSEGRNIGIKSAKNEIITVTDAGCFLDKEWLKEITQPFISDEVKAVAGFYKPVAKSVFQKCLAPYVCVMKRDPSTSLGMTTNGGFCHFLPSSRSVAFRKEVWNIVGGYPNNLNYCEDLVFDQKVVKAGYHFFFVPKAIVYWPMKDNLLKAFKQFFNYAVGDGQVFFSNLQTHSLKISLVFLRYLFFTILIIGGYWGIIFFYLFWAIGKNYRYVKNLQAIFILPVLQVVSDLAVMLGTIKGMLRITNILK